MGCSSSMFEAKGSKAVTGGQIYASRPCSQGELPQCGCSRKLLWISQSVKWFDVQLEGWRESKTSGCKCPMIKSVQASADLDTLSPVLLASSVCILAIVNWCTWQRHWRSIGHYKVSQPFASCLKPQELWQWLSWRTVWGYIYLSRLCSLGQNWIATIVIHYLIATF